MPDTLDERLAGLGADLEAAAGIGSPAFVRSRGDQIATAHRRRVVAMTATTAAVAVLGVGGLAALRSGGGPQKNVVGPAASTSGNNTGNKTGNTTGSRSTQPATGRTPDPFATATTPAPAKGFTPAPGSVQTTAVVDLAQHQMTLIDRKGLTMKTLKVTAGSQAHPTPVGTYTVTAKFDRKTISSEAVGTDSYNIVVSWYIELDGGGPRIYAAPWWDDSVFGTANKTRTDIGLRPSDAQWLSENLAVGDRVVVQ